MTLQDILLENRSRMANNWYERILESYAAETAKFYRRKTDSFANPIGQNMVPALNELYAGLIGGAGPKELLPHIDAVVRIRAVQDFSAGEAVFFIFQLKELIRQELGSKLADHADELRNLEDRIDLAALMAFDIYVGCREQIYSFKSKELQDQTSKILERSTRNNKYRKPETA